MDSDVKFFKLQSVIPFETAFAAFCVYSGLAGVLDFGIISNIFREVLGDRLALCFNLLYVLAGLLLFFGIGFNKRNTEALGLIVISGSLLVRSIVTARFVGVRGDIVGSYVFAAMFITASAVRLSWLRKSVFLVQANGQMETLTDLKDTE